MKNGLLKILSNPSLTKGAVNKVWSEQLRS